MRVADVLLAAALSCGYFGAAPETQPGLWGSDGCSSSPDLQAGVSCCDDHDLGYRIGGPWGDWSERGRRVEDVKLELCLLLRREIPEAAVLVYYDAVRRLGTSSWERNRKAAGR